MKRLIFIFFLLFLCFSAVNAQTSETINELTPVPKYLGKFSKRLPKSYGILADQKFKFDVKVEFVNLSGGKKGVAVTIKTTNEDAVFESISDKPTARIDIYGRITSKDKTTDGFFEERWKVILDNVKDAADFNKIAKNPIILRKVFELREGKYQIGIILRDFTSGMRGVKVVKFVVPDSDLAK